MPKEPVFVTRPDMPPLKEFVPYLEEIWANKTLTNNGPFHQQLEKALADYLGVEHLSLFANGTIALIVALKALGISGEVITTPYSFVATSHALLWNNIKPVFVDIEPHTCNLDPAKIEQVITPRTTAILPVHCYGNPCSIEQISLLAKKYGLKIIYDAAHAFGVEYKGKSLLNEGDISVLSMHATKVFTTCEGGAIVCKDAATKRQIDELKNFGIVDELTVTRAGINGKMSELHAAFGLLQLNYVDQALHRRREIEKRYRDELAGVCGISFLPVSDSILGNSSYAPILVGDNSLVSRDELYEKLKQKNIYCRRYFYPLISDMKMYKDLPGASPQNLPVARDISERLICLPIFPDLSDNQVDEIIAQIRSLAEHQG